MMSLLAMIETVLIKFEYGPQTGPAYIGTEAIMYNNFGFPIQTDWGLSIGQTVTRIIRHVLLATILLSLAYSLTQVPLSPPLNPPLVSSNPRLNGPNGTLLSLTYRATQIVVWAPTGATIS